MELFKPVFCATALIGIHIGRPFLSLLLDTETNYDAPLDAFPKLHLNLTDTEISKYSQFESVVCDFVNQDHFKKSLPKSCLLESLTGSISQYKKEVLHFLSICWLKVLNYNEERHLDLENLQMMKQIKF